MPLPCVFETPEEVIAASSVLDTRRRLIATDCRRVTTHPTERSAWISTPNMDLVPELPPDCATVHFFEDGMMGPWEFNKWPQLYEPKAPYAMACPGNPDILLCPTNTFYVQDMKSVLPKFKDTSLPWTSIRSTDFKVTDAFPVGEYGILSTTRLDACSEALEEIVGKVEIVTEWMGNASMPDEEELATRRHSLEQAENLVGRLHQTFVKLFGGDLSTFETMLIFREYQRVLLALRGWVIYQSVIRPRLRDVATDYSQHPLPLRGVFSSDPIFVATMYRIGVPVWYLRLTSSFTSETVVGKCVGHFSARVSFSSRSVMRFGQHRMDAPVWARPVNDDPTVSTLLERIERVSVSNHAVIAETRDYDPDRASQVSMLDDDTNDMSVVMLDDVGADLPVDIVASMQELEVGDDGKGIMAAMELAAAEDGGVWSVHAGKSFTALNGNLY